MVSTWSDLKIELLGAGDDSGTWGNVTNNNFNYFEQAIAESVDVTFASGAVTLTLADEQSEQSARYLRLNLTGTSGGAQNLVVPTIEKPYVIKNGCADEITVKTTAGTGIGVPAGKTMWVYVDGTNVVDVVSHLSSLTLDTPLPVASGGTGSNTAAGARTSLSAAISGTNDDITSMTSTSGVSFGTPTVGSFPGTIGAINAVALYDDGVVVDANAKVSSVAASGGTTGMSFTGGPVTTSGTLTLTGTLAVANGGTGATTASGARTALGLGSMSTQASSSVAITGGTIAGASISGGSISGITDLGVADGGTGASTGAGARTNLGAAASGSNSDITALVNTAGIQIGAPTLGAQGSGTLNATGLFINGVAVGTGSGSVTSVAASGGSTGLTFTGSPISTSGTLTLGGTVAVASGGTGQTSFTNGQLLIGNSTGGTLTKGTISSGTGITVTNGGGTISIAADNNGTVTSVAGSGGTTGLSFTGSPITSSGTLTLTGTLALANGGTGASLSDPGADRILFWDDSVGATGWLTPGAGIVITGTSISASGATVADSDYGDVTVTSSGTVWTIDADVVTYAKMQNTGGTDVLLGRSTAGAGNVEEIACTAFGRSLLDDADATAGRATLALGSMATQASSSVSITGGSISGITDLGVADGGTGASTAAGARTNLGVVIGTDVQAYDVDAGKRTIDQSTDVIPDDTEIGQHIYTAAGVTISAGVFNAGDVFAIVNSGTSGLTITSSAVTAYLANDTGAAKTSFTLAGRGMCSVLCVASNTFYLSGAGLS
tara:strand:+ start:21998 stop:24337 length:2340 start_codon:yes stop_codon:yes gene_type:complete